jgi:hypothetical protein
MIDRISYEDSTVFVNLTKADIQQAAEIEQPNSGAPIHGTASFRG